MTDVIVCWSRCWPCQFDEHHTPPEWHTWADDDDIEHALENGRPDPSDQKCACPCAGPKSSPSRADISPRDGAAHPDPVSRDGGSGAGCASNP